MGQTQICPLLSHSVAERPYAFRLTLPDAYNYIGCYKDTPSRDLPYMHSFSDNGPDKCDGVCRSRGYSYFGYLRKINYSDPLHRLQFTDQCFCGNKYGTYGLASNCDARCPSNSAIACGGTWANSVYVVTGMRI